VYSISAMKGDGCRELCRDIGEFLETVKRAEEHEAEEASAPKEQAAKIRQPKVPLTNAQRAKEHLEKESKKS